ncbi:hypothetical protein [Mesorhizobium sp. B2-9-1]|uniref:hypothetical protein n=1 Tax=Mesorhizobium sp. B2-9-1 TaxID=2589898 RepID=UPI0015E368FE|nr:hypothetical protein [Mesorhizobium sp. B2-9-1]
MNRKTIPVEDAAKDWFKDPEFVAEFNAFDAEFAMVEAVIKTSKQIDQMRKPRTSGTAQGF